MTPPHPPFFLFFLPCCPYLEGYLIEFGQWGINLGAVWSESGNWIQVRFLHVVIKVTRGKKEGGMLWGKVEGVACKVEWGGRSIEVREVSKAVWMTAKRKK